MTNYRYRRGIRLVFLGTCVLFLSIGAGGQTVEADIRKLVDIESWSAKELADFNKGDAVVRSLNSKDKQELATIGIVKIENLPAATMEIFRQSLDQRSEGSMRSGARFSEPPVLHDLDDLKLDDETIAQLRKCSPRRCDLNLSAVMIERLHTIDWTSADARQRATEMIREMLLSYAFGYTTLGIESLGTYDNRRKAINLSAAHRGLLQSSSQVSFLAPDFYEYLETYPANNPGNVENSMHWAVVDFGIKPSITLSHTAAYSQIKNGGHQFFVASRQIYASRYLDCAQSFAILISGGEDWNASYLIFINRSRSDALDGAFGSIARSVAKKEASERIRKMLDKTHLRLLALSRPVIGDAGESSEKGFFTWPAIAVLGIASALLVAIALRKRLRSKEPARHFKLS